MWISSLPDHLRLPLLAVAVAVLVAAIGVAAVTRPEDAVPTDEVLLSRLIERPAPDVTGVVLDAKGIVDPVVRQAAVMEWIRRNQTEFDPVAVVRVCEILEGVAKDACLRKATSPHLQGIAPQ